ncbi:MAG: bifunctional phosphoglucose/phosphomannose isomerase [Planctomycetota bacterium]|nr:bifunctional phosphoglucose/phosphomannose isomerase [Planctomycetota bacterium]MDA1138712.1 bifunctional phosphoglucose/phosphomannose isomerase [Planctomycetota bacterium]
MSLNKKAIQEIDKSRMGQLIKEFPLQFARGLSIGRGVSLKGKINRVIVTGMGGSALPADILDLHLGPLTVPLDICRDYGPRFDLDRRTLVLASSFSGNTEETLSSFKRARKSGAKIVAITSGGKLKAAAEKAGAPVALIPEDAETFQPRLAAGYFFSIYAGILESLGLVSFKKSELERLPVFLDEQMRALESQGRALAHQLVGKIAVFYTPEAYGRSVSRINKIKVNENAKSPAFWNTIPEMNHNEMQGFAFETYPLHFVFIQDPADSKSIQNRFKILGRQLKKKGYQITLFEMPGDTNVEKAFAGLLYGDWASYYLALLRGIDPTPVDFIEDFKRELKKA